MPDGCVSLPQPSASTSPSDTHPSDTQPRSARWPTALTVAGADSSGGAGLATDLATFAACGVHGAFALTLVSAQNTAEFRAANPVGAEMVAAQIHAVLDDMPVAAAKTGLLLTEDTVATVASIAERRLPLLVADPVLVSGVGEPMLSAATERAIVQQLLPQARVATPNHLEAGRLLGRELGNEVAAWIEAAYELAALGPKAVIITGGRHQGPDAITDVAVIDGEVHLLSAERIVTRNVRGSGDVFSAAICAELAKGTELKAAITRAHHLTVRAISAGTNRRLGSGPGPVGPIPALAGPV